MTLIGNLSTPQRVLLSVLILLVCMAGISLVVMNATRAGNDATDSVMEDRQPPEVQIARMLEIATQNRRLALTAVQHDPRNSEAELIAQPFSSLRPQLERNLDELNRITRAYQSSSLSAEEQSLLDTVAAEHQAFVEKGLNPVFEAAESDRFDEATRLFYRQLEPAFARYRTSIGSLKQLYSDTGSQQ